MNQALPNDSLIFNVFLNVIIIFLKILNVTNMVLNLTRQQDRSDFNSAACSLAHCDYTSVRYKWIEDEKKENLETQKSFIIVDFLLTFLNLISQNTTLPLKSWSSIWNEKSLSRMLSECQHYNIEYQEKL